MRYRSYTDKKLITFSDIQEMPGYEDRRLISHSRPVPNTIRHKAEKITEKGIENQQDPHAN